MTIRLLDGKAVNVKRARGRTQLYDDIGNGLFPRPIKISRLSRWTEHETDTILAAEIAGKTRDEIRTLVKELEAARLGETTVCQ